MNDGNQDREYFATPGRLGAPARLERMRGRRFSLHRRCALTVVVWAGVGGVLAVETARAEKLKWGPNRVANNSFESLFENWNVRLGARLDGPRKEATVEIDTSVAHTGVHSLKFSGDSETTLWYAVESEPIPITPGKRYRFSAWLKAEDIKVENGQYHNCNAYIQFRDQTGKIIPLGISPLRRTYPSRGTHDWFDAFAMVVAPEGATQARIGVTLTCSGTVWFDDVALQESEDYAWAKRTSVRFNWYFTQGDEPPEGLFDQADVYLGELERLLDVRRKAPIAYYKYKSVEQKTELTDRSSESHIDGGAIHSVKWDEREDMVHVLMQSLGPSTLVLAEGVALYATAAVEGRDVHAPVRKLIKEHGLIPIDTFLDASTLTVAPQHVQEAEFGSFVGFLIQRYGIEKFKKLYAYPNVQDPRSKVAERFQEVYGKSLDEGQREWILFLQGDKSTPEPASASKE